MKIVPESPHSDDGICAMHSREGIEVIDAGNERRWKEALAGFGNVDVFFRYEYNAALMLHGDGNPKLVYFEYQGAKLAYVMFENDISMLEAFEGVLERGRYFDWTSQYGYGGPLSDGDITEQMLHEFREKLFEYCANHQIVSQFFRFHPLLQNHMIMENVCEPSSLKKVVSADVRRSENIDTNMTSKCRNLVRKAIKNNVEIVSDRGENAESFFAIYNATMTYHQADEYYFFQKRYFQYLIENMKDNIIFFYAKKDERIVSAALFLYGGRYMHYYLGGTLVEYRQYAPTNLLLRAAAYWANEKGMDEFLLGGGMEADDSLFHFKKGFNPQGVREFYIGRTIFNQDAFNELVRLRKQLDNSFNENTPFLIRYRAGLRSI